MTTTAVAPRTDLVIRLDDSPRYAGSVHDDAVARRMGYRAALVPGAFLYGHFSRVAVEAWGLDWIARGAIGARFRRPVFNGDAVSIHATPSSDAEAPGRVDLVMIGEGGEEVASGFVAPPAPAAALPAPIEWPIRPLPDPRPVVTAGGMLLGVTGGTDKTLVTPELLHESREAFDERHPIYAAGDLAHPGFVMRRAMFDVNGGFRFPAPVVLVSCEARHFAAIGVGQTLVTASRVTGAFERKGRHYLETDEVVFADGRPAARHRRVQIYA